MFVVVFVVCGILYCILGFGGFFVILEVVDVVFILWVVYDLIVGLVLICFFIGL